LLQVNDTHKALTQLAAYHRAKMQATIIAVTGSCGKTTTKSLLASVFSQQAETLANSSSFNNNIGVPLTLLKLKSKHRYAICEIGANHPGEIATLTHLVKPNIAIITNAAAAHLEGFGDIDGVACAKGEIFQGLQADGIAIINADDAHADFWKKQLGEHRIVTFGIKNNADVMATDIQLNARLQASFQLVTPAGKIQVTLALMGEHNIMNALTAAAAAYAANIAIPKIKKGLALTQAVDKRLIEKTGYRNAVIIDDSYNANPLSTSAAIALLAKRAGDSMLVLGDMLELGENADQLHKTIGQLAKKEGINTLYCIGKHCKHTAAAFGENAHHFEDHASLIKTLRDHLHENMTVLIKGSNSMNMHQVTEALTLKHKTEE